MLPPFQAFLDAHRDDVWRFLVAAVGAEEAKDAFQETFLAALRAYPKLARADNLRGWVLTIAHRKALDSHRSRKRTPAPTDRVPDRANARVADTDPELWAAVRGLPPRQRDAVVYRFVNDLPYRQIAEVMSCTAEAARRNVHEGVRKLREVLEA